MSGPKVIRIVTREEMESIKTTHVSQLESVVNDIKAYVEKNKVFDDKQLLEIERRLAQYKNLDASEYRKFQSEIPSQIDFLEAEQQRLVNTVKKRVLSRREKSRHLIASIDSLKLMYEKRSLELPDNIRKLEKNNQLLWVSSEEVIQIEQTISDAFSALTLEQTLDKESAELSQRLNQGQEIERFSDWLLKASLVKPTASQQRLEATIAELEAGLFDIIRENRK